MAQKLATAEINQQLSLAGRLEKKAFDLTETRILLRRMIASGYVTMEQLDQPSPGWVLNAKTFRLHYPKYTQTEYVNPLRTEDPEPTVEVSDPRDFTPTEGATPAQSPDLEVDW